VGIAIELGEVGALELDHVGLIHDPAQRVAADPDVIGDADTVVSITFDDGRASQIRALPVLETHGVAASFFVNSGRLGLDGYLTVADARRLADAGHEIGGHTVDHARLVSLAPDEQRRQICNDRAVLVELGFAAEGFAYPLSARDLTAIDAAEACGYSGARLAGGLELDGSPAQPFDHIRPYEVPAVASVTEETTVADLQAAVLAAEETGGWINVVFHDLCDGCNEFGMSVEEFDEFVGWVAGRGDEGTIVLPFSAVMGREANPHAVAGPAPTRAVDPEAALVNADFTVTDMRDPSVPLCWDASYSAGIDAAVAVVDDETDADSFVRLRIDGTVAVGASARIESARDQGECAPNAAAGTEPVVSLRHRGSGEAVIELFVRDASGSWSYHSRSEPLGDQDDWRRQIWVAPPLPDDAVALAVRVALRSPGQVDVDDVVVGLGQGPTDPRPGGVAAG
jgi:peptidoglycan/xylan/chitin deacetylase (PgdA/CDA1 family)